MKITLITVGTPHLPFAKDGIKEYLKRIHRFMDIDVIHIKDDKNAESKILKSIGAGHCVLLDEIGKEYTSRELARMLEKNKNQSQNMTLVIGGPDGHSDAVRSRGDSLLSLSRLTFPHDIAMMITLEALYRAATINAGHPYHRD